MVKSISKRGLNANENLAGLFFVLPAIVPLLVFWIFPVAWSFLLSFTDWDMMSPNMKIVRLRNYISLLKDLEFAKVLRNTFVFALGNMIPSIILGFAIAYALVAGRHGVGFFRTVIFSPYITPMVAISIVWSWIFEPRAGILNALLRIFNITGIRWTQGVGTAMVSVIIVSVWKQLGWIMVFFMNAINNVPKSILEASVIDGAGVFRRIFCIIVPQVSPTTYFLIIISTIGSLQAYEQIMVLTRGGPAGATRTIIYYFYQEAFTNFAVGRASAIAVFLVIITVILSVIETAVSKNSVHYD
jgi:multiple sugar transport system permease protein